MTKKAGFTMVEILLALGVFIIGVFAIISVFPGVKESVVNSEDKTMAAQFVNSLSVAISQGANDFGGANSATSSIEQKDVVFFTFDINKVGGDHDFFVLPQDTTPAGDKGPSEVVWYPVKKSGSWPLSRSEVAIGTMATPGSNQVDGQDGFTGLVRRIGRSALGSSIVDELITDTEGEFPERIRNFYFCFSVARAIDAKNTNVPQEYFLNLYKFTLYMYHQGADQSSIPVNTEQSDSEVFTLRDPTNPTGKGNNFIEKFDFLINIRKEG